MSGAADGAVLWFALLCCGLHPPPPPAASEGQHQDGPECHSQCMHATSVGKLRLMMAGNARICGDMGCRTCESSMETHSMACGHPELSPRQLSPAGAVTFLFDNGR